MSKLWKYNGPEQKYLEKLFRENHITSDSKPALVQIKYPMFEGFSAAVFRKHFSLTKQKFNVNFESYRNPTLDSDDFSNLSVGNIPELDGPGTSGVSPEKKPKLSFRDAYNEKVTTAAFTQPPILPCVYTDPITKQDKCVVVVLLFNGVKTINFDLIKSDDTPEPTLKITYYWPPSMFNVTAMFTNDKEQSMILSNLHPKVLAIEKTLELFRDNLEDTPVGHIEIQLPVEVQMDPSTWVKTYNKKHDGNIIVFFEFLCIRHNYVISNIEKTLNFE